MASHRVVWQEEFPLACRGGAVAMGNFDGAHRGHAALIRQLVERASATDSPAVALTFDPHPLTFLRPGIVLELLTTPLQRAEYLHQLGADEVLILHVTPEFLQLGAGEFFTEVVQNRLQARALVEGTNFAFGRQREGTLDVLASLCRSAGVSLEIVEPVSLDGVEVSSSRIRADLLRGDVAAAARLLGRLYRLQGHVGSGQRRGRTIGFPTANLERVETIIPGDGVYAVKVTLADGRQRLGAANVGPNPTFAEQARKIEIHVLDFAGDLYGQSLSVDFVERLRETRPFASVSELIDQLHQDVARVRLMSNQGGDFR